MKDGRFGIRGFYLKEISRNVLGVLNTCLTLIYFLAV